jgi:hypothetical protein
MKINFKQFLLVFILPIIATTVISCTEEEGALPLSNSTTPPGMVDNLTIQNLPGKAKLTYSLPEDDNLLYVIARYKLENGMKMEEKASYFSNTMLLEGFAGESEIEVTVSAVSKSEVESEPVTVTVEPLKAPIFDVFESLETGADFGGLSVSAQNPTEESIAVLIMQKNDVGDWEPLPTSIYTRTSEISQSLRGFDTIPQEFAIAIRDRWLNVTDTLFTEITPLYEQLMPKTDYRAVSLPNDASTIDNAYPVSNLWDNEFFYWWGSYFTARNLDLESHLVSFDIGKKTKLSRLRIWAFSEPIGGQQLYYYLGAMKRFRIWGANELNNGDLSNWTLMGEYEVNKPSGLPYGQENNDDLIAAQDGADYEISIEKPAVRYLRIESLENWAGGEFMAISETHVYGNPDFVE